MIGMAHLLRLREAGKRPETVFVSFGIPYLEPKFDIDLRNLELSYRKTHDYRPFIGLDVILISEKWTQDMADCYEAMKDYANTIAVLIIEFGDDVGFQWDKEHGQRDYVFH